MKFEELIKIAYEVDESLFGKIRNDSLFDHLDEEVSELKDATEQLKNRYSANVKLNQTEELGDVIFCLIAFSRQNDINFVQALSLTLIKLKDRYKQKQKNG